MSGDWLRAMIVRAASTCSSVRGSGGASPACSSASSASPSGSRSRRANRPSLFDSAPLPLISTPADSPASAFRVRCVGAALLLVVDVDAEVVREFDVVGRDRLARYDSRAEVRLAHPPAVKGFLWPVRRAVVMHDLNVVGQTVGRDVEL